MDGHETRWPTDPAALLSLGTLSNPLPNRATLLPSLPHQREGGTQGISAVCPERGTATTFKSCHLTYFYMQTGMQSSQSGTGALSPPLPSPAKTTPQDPVLIPEDMDSSVPNPTPYQGSPSDRGKRSAQSPAPSPAKVLLYKKQHWAETADSEGTQESLAAHPASDQPASENLKTNVTISTKRPTQCAPLIFILPAP